MKKVAPMSIAAALIASLLGLATSASPASAQSDIVRVFDEFTVRVGPENDDSTLFNIEWPTGQVTTFTVPDVFDPRRLARDLGHYGNSRLVIRSNQRLVLVDTQSGAVVDRFLALRWKQSPSGRYLAIQRHTPNGVAFVDSVYSVYDLQRPPEQNRPANTESLNAGRIVYPPANVTAQSYSVASTPTEAHNLLSPLTWANASLLSLLDHHSGVVKLVLIDVSAGIDLAKKSEAVLNLSEVLLPTATAQAPFLNVVSIETVSMSENDVSLRLVFEPAWFLRVGELVLQVPRPQ